ncbi:PLP-dependent transferase [Saccharothrix sp. ALI-22-I]|uniref:PLP-dependent transferase n=1 Tax=Saccharothrix sp. ALI-22-I TaxID=1933778 RepID=UPI001EE6FA6F|nr:PLP-dependent transferase [Saccharothrix sp. ALI-22-I]
MLAFTTREHPAASTHRLVPAADREASGVPVNLLRLSVGLEDVEDIWVDLDQALSGHCEQHYIKSSSSDFREPAVSH